MSTTPTTSTIPIVTPSSASIVATTGAAGDINNLAQDFLNFAPVVLNAQAAIESAITAPAVNSLDRNIKIFIAADTAITPYVPVPIVQAVGGIAAIAAQFIDLFVQKAATPATVSVTPTSTPVPVPAAPTSTPAAPAPASAPSPSASSVSSASSALAGATPAQLQALIADANAQLAADTATAAMSTPAPAAAPAQTAHAVHDTAAAAAAQAATTPAIPSAATASATAAPAVKKSFNPFAAIGHGIDALAHLSSATAAYEEQKASASASATPTPTPTPTPGTGNTGSN